MSHFATPIIVINLGCEMIYVIEQRLKSQNIPLDKSERVLTDIVTVLLHPNLHQELFTPQPVATHAVIKQLLQDISATSIMKLDDYSMNKLWDLITMIFKWQISPTTITANNLTVFDICQKHLKGVATLMPAHFPKRYIELVIKNIESLREKFSNEDYKCLYNTLIIWFSEYHTKISILLRLGLQNKDGTFNSSAINPRILQHLGENIYKYDNKNNHIENYQHCFDDSNEINCLLSHMDNVYKKNSVVQIQLPMDVESSISSKRTSEIKREIHIQQIITSIKGNANDLSFVADIPNSPQQDLLEMLGDI